jgi:Tol biopolymer transport system component/DNA-binding winged helix-turn-helix (wHTH) protein
VRLVAEDAGAVPILENVNRIAFGLFEVDLQAGELWKAGFRVRLAGQPFKVLITLLSRPGEVVTREELQAEIWGSNTNVDFERALAGTINKVREALGDSAENPRFIQTLTKRGYRFIYPVSIVTVPARLATPPATPEASVALTPPVVPPPAIQEAAASLVAAEPTTTSLPLSTSPAPVLQSTPSARWRTRELVVAAIAVLLLVTLLWTRWSLRRLLESPPLRIEQVTHYTPISTGPPNVESFLTLAMDGDRILTSVMVSGRPRLSAIDITTGEVQRLATPQELSSNSLADISRDGTKLLLRARLSSESEQALWVVPSAGGSGFRVGNILAHDATWMPDGRSILYANGNDLAVVRPDNGVSVSYVSLQGRAFWLRWSSDGKLLRFTLMDPVTHSAHLWELESGDRIPHLVRKADLETLSSCCGTWTADGSAYVFAANDNLWELKGSGRNASLLQLTNGPLHFFSPVAARSGSRIYFLGLEPPSGLERYSAERKEFQPAPAFLSDANRVDYSRDGVWVAWTDTHERLWRARAVDGSDKVQLTSDSLEVFLAHWSPDGQRLAIMARERGSVWQTYLVDASGGKPELLLKETRNAADPGWSPDGHDLVFGREPDLMGKESGSHSIQILNLASHQTAVIPGSEGLFSPRWSPDGRWIAALALDQKSVMLYDVAEKRWQRLATTSAADPVWSTDSRTLYLHAFLADREPILRISVPDGAIQMIADLSNFHDAEASNYFFGGLSPSGAPFVLPRVGTGNLYTLDLSAR